MLKLSSENKKFIKVILDGFFRIYLAKLFSNFKPKKHKAFTQYTIISAVYNVEKYLNDYFKSIINQRLDFERNIFMILVDDGSTDNSAQIIKTYQKKYPKNIIYLYKENGGQASARNLGLKYMQENDYQTPWVTFTDPDDFLDRNYFYKVDKFLATHKDNDICMIGCNIIFYHEKQKLYKDNHPLNFKFKNGIQVRENYNLDNFIQLSVASCFINVRYLNKLLFDEELKPNFEDAKFINEYLLENINLKSTFLPKAKYFYRKRKDGSSTLDVSNTMLDLYFKVSKQGCLYLLERNTNNENFIQYVILYHFFWQIKVLINSPEKLSFMSQSEKQRYLEVLDQNFSYIDNDIIMKFNLADYWFFYKVGILNCFKNKKPPFQIVYIEDYDPHREQILLTYYTGDDKDAESILVGGKQVYADYEKIVKYGFLDRVFYYQKRLWVHISKNTKDKLEIFINDEKSMIDKYDQYFLDIENIKKEFQKRLPKSDIWLFMDKDYEADDNAEHLYRYIMQNHPEQEIVFALRKENLDWERLEKEGFKLVKFGSFEFERIMKRVSKVVSSHADEYLIRYITPRQQFVFLQHGTIKDNLSQWLNSKKIDLFITSTNAEYNSIVNDYNHYKFGKKEVVLTGLARHDALLKNNKTNTKQILIMPTWRHYLSGLMIGNSGVRELKDGFIESEYFQKWNLLLNNSILRKLCEKYSYVIIFNPHSNIIPYLKAFHIPSYIKISNQNESLQKLFCESSLMITDYSSVAFEIAYLNKPVIYYQFDKDEFFSSHTYQKGYFNYRKDGFGPVVENEENLLQELENLLQDDCKIFGVYKDNINSTFAFKDGKCCERNYKVIKYGK
ncbi:glycosyltransferase [Campylobacter coli]|nr:glycosyltransferase [Campylobacter coli]